jgi:methionine-rich copper-binding protein CopC
MIEASQTGGTMRTMRESSNCKPSRSAYLMVGVPLLVMALVITLGVSATVAHFRLERSEPAAEAVVAEVAEVRLWFSQEPQSGSTSIRVVNAAGELVPAAEVAASTDDPRVQFLALDGPLLSGAYRVFWRAMAADGHVVRDEFVFTVGP